MTKMMWSVGAYKAIGQEDFVTDAIPILRLSIKIARARKADMIYRADVEAASTQYHAGKPTNER